MVKDSNGEEHDSNCISKYTRMACVIGAGDGIPEDKHKKWMGKKARAADGILTGEPITKVKKKAGGRNEHPEVTFKRVTHIIAHA